MSSIEPMKRARRGAAANGIDRSQAHRIRSWSAAYPCYRGVSLPMRRVAINGSFGAMAGTQVGCRPEGSSPTRARPSVCICERTRRRRQARPVAPATLAVVTGEKAMRPLTVSISGHMLDLTGPFDMGTRKGIPMRKLNVRQGMIGGFVVALFGAVTSAESFARPVAYVRLRVRVRPIVRRAGDRVDRRDQSSAGATHPLVGSPCVECSGLQERGRPGRTSVAVCRERLSTAAR